MTNTPIPQEWSVGIAPVDQEHQELFDLLHAVESKTNPHFFEEFFSRFSALSNRREDFLKKVGYYNVNFVSDCKNRTLNSLKQKYNDVPQAIIGICRTALLKEISDADLYYNKLDYTKMTGEYRVGTC